ncbi:hypothetical protein O181_040493 [Austropuccinia psidii MF-1]|uniref:Uncharacterized protein n=1 Tax=Austropuccinia psidii MF-1 TaxID=1389203 RepID=A0A9Q3DFG6_9BASI|nr:hypothetical protein [Austropuccinia psidii MF-1]
MHMLLHQNQDMPLPWHPHIRPHPPSCFCTPSSQHDHDPAGPSPLLTTPPTALIIFAAYCPYAHVVPSQHSSIAALTTPYASEFLSLSSPALTILWPLQSPQYKPPKPPPHHCPNPSLCLRTPAT